MTPDKRLRIKATPEQAARLKRVLKHNQKLSVGIKRVNNNAVKEDNCKEKLQILQNAIASHKSIYIRPRNLKVPFSVGVTKRLMSVMIKRNIVKPFSKKPGNFIYIRLIPYAPSDANPSLIQPAPQIGVPHEQ